MKRGPQNDSQQCLPGWSKNGPTTTCSVVNRVVLIEARSLIQAGSPNFGTRPVNICDSGTTVNKTKSNCTSLLVYCDLAFVNIFQICNNKYAWFLKACSENLCCFYVKGVLKPIPIHFNYSISSNSLLQHILRSGIATLYQILMKFGRKNSVQQIKLMM